MLVICKHRNVCLLAHNNESASSAQLPLRVQFRPTVIFVIAFCCQQRSTSAREEAQVRWHLLCQSILGDEDEGSARPGETTRLNGNNIMAVICSHLEQQYITLESKRSPLLPITSQHPQRGITMVSIRGGRCCWCGTINICFFFATQSWVRRSNQRGNN